MNNSFTKLIKLAEELEEKYSDVIDTDNVPMKIYHADHGVSEELIRITLEKANPKDGFFIITEPTNATLENGLYGPISGDPEITEDEVFYKQRSADRPPSRMIDKPKRPTNLLTIIGVKAPDNFEIYTAYGGPLAPREPGDPSLSPGELSESKDFWSKHALAAE